MFFQKLTHSLQRIATLGCMNIQKYIRTTSLLVLKPVLRANRRLSERGLLPHRISPAVLVVACFILTAISVQATLNAKPLRSELTAADINDLKAERVALNVPSIDIDSRKLADLIAFQPNKATGLSGGAVLSVFKEPDLEKRDGKIAVLQYQSEVCVADFHFKLGQDKNLNTSKLSSFSFYTRDVVIAEQETVFAQDLAQAGEQRDCLQSILKDKDTTPNFFKFASADITQKL